MNMKRVKQEFKAT